MKDDARAWSRLIGLTLLLCLHVGAAEGAELRYIRIGEHKAFTRIVFEFRGPVVFKEPVITGKGNCSVVFKDTSTALPKQIRSETTERIEIIGFTHEKTELTANITLAFPYFKIKAFPLSNPERVVLDVSRLNQPPRGVVFEEPLVEKPAPSTLPAPPDKKVTTESKPVLKPEPPAGKVEAEPAAVTKRSETKGPLPPSATPPPHVAPHLPALPEKQGEAPASMEDPSDPSDPSGREAWHSHYQTYLLGVLVLLSVIMVGLLAFVVFRKRRRLDGNFSTFGAAIGKAEGFEIVDVDDNIAAIDAKIKDEFRKIDQKPSR